MSQPDTKEKILDAAEKLFAHEGFHNTSLRSITGEAEVNLAAVNYHFGSKEALLEAVIDRRLRPLNQTRQDNIELIRNAALDSGTPPTVEATLRAFVEPTLRFRESGAGAGHFVTLVGQALAEPDETVRNLFVARMRPLFLLLFDTLCLALPQHDRSLLFWRLHFSLGAIGHTLCWTSHLRRQPQTLPEGVHLVEKAADLCELLVSFLTHGMEAPCA